MSGEKCYNCTLNGKKTNIHSQTQIKTGNKADKDYILGVPSKQPYSCVHSDSSVCVCRGGERGGGVKGKVFSHAHTFT